MEYVKEMEQIIAKLTIVFGKQAPCCGPGGAFDLKEELSFFMSDDEIELIMDCLKEFGKRRRILA